jgi:hypothetical protein
MTIPMTRLRRSSTGTALTSWRTLEGLGTLDRVEKHLDKRPVGTAQKGSSMNPRLDAVKQIDN